MNRHPSSRIGHLLTLISIGVIALASLAGTAASLLRPQPDSRTLAVLIPPFDNGRTMRSVIESGLSIIDLRLNGHLVVVQTVAGMQDATALRAAGLMTIAANPPPSCLERNPQT